MGAYSNPERHADDGKPLTQFSAIQPRQPGPDPTDQQRGKVLEQLPSLVKAWVQDAAAENEGVVQAVLQAIAEPLFLLDRGRRIVACNEAAAKRVGREVQDLIGVPMSEYLAAVVPGQVSEQRMARIVEAFRSGESVRFTDEAAGRVYENAICPVLDGSGQVAAVVASSRDITGYRRIQAEPHGSGESQEHTERLASLGMISAALTHELMQPLSVVQLATQNVIAELERLTCPDVVRQDLQAGLAACRRIGGIVGRFRELVRPPGKTKETEVHIPLAVERTFRLLERSAAQARVSFGTENLDALPAIRMGENELEDLLFVVVQNAVQAADGAKERRLLVTGVLQEDAVVLRFQDDCGGIKPEHLSRIFEPFFTTKPSDKGTGLGLCIARHFVCQRGGQISVESRYGEGTTFTVTLPRESRPGAGGQYVP